MRALRAALLMAGFSLRAAAEPTSFITVESTESCAVSSAELEARVTGALVAPRAEDATARVVIEANDRGFETTLQTSRAGEPAGTKQVTAPSCEEAVEAAVVVLALALAEPVREEPEPPPLRVEIARPEAPRRREPRWFVPAEPVRDAPSARARDESVRLSLATGLDSGTLPVTTGFVSVGAAQSLDRFELRAALRYAFPRVDAVDGAAGASESWRQSFAAADAGACYAFGDGFRAAACAGAELGVVRSEHTLQTADGNERNTDQADARAAGVFSVVAAHRGGVIQPELELSTVAAAIGRQEGSGWLAFRAAVGAAVQF